MDMTDQLYPWLELLDRPAFCGFGCSDLHDRRPCCFHAKMEKSAGTPARRQAQQQLSGTHPGNCLSVRCFTDRRDRLSGAERSFDPRR